MEQQKATFVVDYYIMVQGIPDLNLVTAYLNCRHVLFIVEPWPDDWFRIYTRKDVKDELIKSMGIFGGTYGAQRNGIRVSK